MPEYLSPGVYVEEVDTGARPIEQVGMSVCGFVGRAPNADARRNEAVRVTGLEQFRRLFAAGAKAGTPLAFAVHGFFTNGGSVCYVVNLGDDGPVSGNGRGLDALEPIDEITMVAIPGRTTSGDYEAAQSFVESRGDCVALLDGPERVEELEQLTRVATSTTPEPGHPGGTPGLRPRMMERGLGALYFPHLRLPRDPFAPLPDPSSEMASHPPASISVAPSGHVAGICARNDFRRGVHKAPANMTVSGVTGLTQIVTKADQNLLNPIGVNTFRMFPTEGVLLWGARTLAPAASNWRYLSVRRLFIMIEKSIERSTRWIVFEPNDHRLWRTIRRDITAFLTVLWRQRYLMGTSPEQAFFVKCDEETNPPEVVDAGRVETLIGLAPVKPAEFVIFRIGQSQAGATFDGV